MSKALPVVFVAVVIGAFFWYAFLKDGEILTPQPQVDEYISQELQLRFEYPESYDVTLHTTDMEKALVLLPDAYTPPEAGEGPPTITIAMYENSSNLSLEQWVRTDTRSNFKLSSDATLTETSVGGVSGWEYRHSGLYETDAIAVAGEGVVYVFSVGWLTLQDAVRADFQDLVSSVHFIN